MHMYQPGLKKKKLALTQLKKKYLSACFYQIFLFQSDIKTSKFYLVQWSDVAETLFLNLMVTSLYHLPHLKKKQTDIFCSLAHLSICPKIQKFFSKLQLFFHASDGSLASLQMWKCQSYLHPRESYVANTHTLAQLSARPLAIFSTMLH